MKKALVVLLLLALVGGGLFAQVTWSGTVNGGLGALKQGDNDLGFGLMAKDAWVNGVYTQLALTADNDAKTVGFRARIRSQGGTMNHWNNTLPTLSQGQNELMNFYVRRAFGYVKGMDGLLEFQGGRIDVSNVAGNDGVWGSNWFNALGLLAYIYPTSAFTVALGGYSGNALSDAVTWDGTGLTAYAGLRANLGVADVRAQFRFNKADVRAAATGRFAVGPANIGVGAYIQNLQAFADAGRMDFMASAGLNVLEGLDLTLKGIFGMRNDRDGNFLGVGATGAFAVGNVKPGASVAFISGGTYDYTCGLAFDQNWWNANWATDLSYLTINPFVFLGKNVELGAVINMDLSGTASKGFAGYVDFVASF